MRIATVGVSPYALTAKGNLNKRVMHFLKRSGHEVVSFVWGHDCNYHVPDENEKFWHDGIEILPFRIIESVVKIRDWIKSFRPEVLITVGDACDFMYMSQVKQSFSCSEFKWVFVLSNSLSHHGFSVQELLLQADGILCTNPSSRKLVGSYFLKDALDYEWVGSDINLHIDDEYPGFRLMMNCKKTSQDNIAMGMQAVCQLSGDPKLYCHVNTDDRAGDHDPARLQEIFDPEGIVIELPDKYVSTMEGLVEDELADKYRAASIFLALSVVSATSLTVFESLRAGCWPIMNNCGSNKDLAEFLENSLHGEVCRDEFLVESITLMVPGETYISIPDPRDLKEKIMNAKEKTERNKGMRERFHQFSMRYDGSAFCSRLERILSQVVGSRTSICLETM